MNIEIYGIEYRDTYSINVECHIRDISSGVKSWTRFSSGTTMWSEKGGEFSLSPVSLMMELNDVLKARMERDMNVTMVIGGIKGH